MQNKTWTYGDVTKSVEDRIQLLAGSAGADKLTINLHKEWAYGAFLFWDLLTSGWQMDGDRERIELLANNSFSTRAKEGA